MYKTCFQVLKELMQAVLVTHQVCLNTNAKSNMRIPVGQCTLRSLSSMSKTFGLSLLRRAAGEPKPSSELNDVKDAALVST